MVTVAVVMDIVAVAAVQGSVEAVDTSLLVDAAAAVDSVAAVDMVVEAEDVNILPR
jgi:hypothetical protein